MSHSDRYEALMLEHLYGLLEPDEARELQAYLDSPEGVDLRARAEEWRDKLSGAAKVPFDTVQFVPPAPVPAPKPAASAAPRPVPMKAVWNQWMVAASILFLVGLGGPAVYQFGGWYAQSRTTSDMKVALNTQRNALAKLQSEFKTRQDAVENDEKEATRAHEAAQKAYDDALAGALKNFKQRDMTVRLTGPDRVQPGAPNAWTIETVDHQGRATLPRKMDVVVRDQKNTELLRQTHDHPIRPTSLRLPASFWEKVRPGTDLFLEVVAYTDDNRSSTLAERIPLARPIYVTHLVTDKPLYRPGETVRFRSLTLDRATLLPPAHDQHLRFQVKNPDGAVIPLDDANGRVLHDGQPVTGPDQKPVRGIGVGQYILADDPPAGEYTLEVLEVARDGQEKLLETRKFMVSTYTIDVFEKKLEFGGKSFNPGDTIEARIEMMRSTGVPLKDARADILASVDDTGFFTKNNVRLQIESDPQTGQPTKAAYNVRFQLPADLLADKKEHDKPPLVELTVTVRDGTDVERIIRPIPLAEKDLVVEFFPEGGDLVEGVPGRVYFQARTPSGKPADLKGVITDGTQTVAEVATVTDAEEPGVNRGQGVFTLTPKAGAKYFLKLKNPADTPAPTKDGFPLPTAKTDGVVLTALDAVTNQGAAIRVNLQVGKGPKTLQIGAYARGRLISHQRVEVEAGKPVDVQLQGDEALGGVTRVTVFEEPSGADENRRANLIPRAERLVYRKPGQRLDLTAKPDQDRYAPGAKVELELGANDEKERPVPAILLIGVVNQSVIAMADSKTDRLLPAHFLLAGEVKNPADLEHADFLLTDHPKAAMALDLLLGTQGWRRFAEQNILPPSANDRLEVERMLVAHGQRTAAPLELSRLEEQRVSAEYLPKLEQAESRQSQAERAAEEFRAKDEPQFQSRQASAQLQVAYADNQHSTAAAELYHFETRFTQLRSWAFPAFLAGLLVLATVSAGFAVIRPAGARRRSIASAGAALAMASLVMVAINLTEGTEDAQSAHIKQEIAKTNRGMGTFGGATKPGNSVPVPSSPTREPTVPVREKNPAPLPPVKIDEADIRVDRVADLRRRVKAAAQDQNMDAAKDEEAPIARRPAVHRTPTVPSSVVREYAHFRAPSVTANADLTETVYWHPVLVLPDTGGAKVGFQLSDDVGRYRVLVAGHTTDGRIGAAVRMIEVRESAKNGP